MRKKLSSKIPIALKVSPDINNEIIKECKTKYLLILNPDTLWGDNYLETTKKMTKYYFQKKIKNLLMIVHKENSFDERMRGDFSLNNDQLLKKEENDFIYTGLQIINKSLFNNEKVNPFSVNKIWDKAIKNKVLYGFESKDHFIHLTDLYIYNKLVKK